MATTNSTSTYSYLSSVSNRFSGLASGMDIDSLVEKLMKAESAKMEKLQQQKQKYEWQREAYRSVNTKLEAFRTDAFDKYGKTSDFVINSVSNSNESKISAVATASATGSLTISNATKAKAASVISTAPQRSKDTSVSTLMGVDAPSSDKTITLQVIQQDGQYKDVDIKYNSSDTLQTIAKKINDSKAGVTALVGENGEFSLTAKATGKYDANGTDIGGAIRLKTGSETDKLFEKIGFGTGQVLANNGNDAEITVNGTVQKSKTNSFTIAGYNLTVKENTTSETTISSSLDTNAIVDKVKSFIELYNGLITDLKDQTSQKKNYSYSPLTDAQKSEMTEDQIKKWEEQAKKGLLRGDQSIEGALNKMRSAISGASIDLGENKFLNIFTLGIKTNKDGTLVLDNETKLREEIERSPENVASLFTSTTPNAKGYAGIISGVRTAAKSAIDTIFTKAGKEGSVDNTYGLGKNLTAVDKQIDAWKEKLKDIEDRYYKQFSAMETAIQNANTQSSIFMS
jgi:flagellar hook-associated protein 2